MIRIPLLLNTVALSLVAWCSFAAAQTPPAAASRQAPRTADYIIAVVNQELVTAGELARRVEQVRANAQRNNIKLPPEDELKREVLEALIDERVQITYARTGGQKVDDADLERAVANVAAQNQVTPAQLRERLRREGVDYGRFRQNVRDQMLVERAREREVQARIKISDADVEAWIEKQRKAANKSDEYNVAQILVTVPEGASESVVAERRAKAEAALARVRGGEAFEAVAREVSQDVSPQKGAPMGMRPADRLPDVFVQVVKPLKAGEVAPSLLRTPAGFHILKLADKRDAGGMSITQTHVRHILLRPSAQLTREAAAKRLMEFKRQLTAGTRGFEALARENSEDGSAGQGGDLGWAAPGNFVPEFEEAMNALPVNGISDPVVSRFGMHLIQVIDRRQVALDLKQQRDQARNALREEKFEDAYNEWLRDLRSRAYVEMREPPQ